MNNLTYRHEYTIDKLGSETWTWYVENTHGGSHLWIRRPKNGEPCGRIEQHRRKPPVYRTDATPDYPQCRFLNGPCWHEGSSLMAEEAVKHHKEGSLDHEKAFGFAAKYLPYN